MVTVGGNIVDGALCDDLEDPLSIPREGGMGWAHPERTNCHRQLLNRNITMMNGNATTRRSLHSIRTGGWSDSARECVIFRESDNKSVTHHYNAPTGSKQPMERRAQQIVDRVRIKKQYILYRLRYHRVGLLQISVSLVPSGVTGVGENENLK